MRRGMALFTSLLISLLAFAVILLSANGGPAVLAAGAGGQTASIDGEVDLSHAAGNIQAQDVVTGADLRIIKFSEPHDTVLAGEQFTYTIIIDNLGPISATNIIMTDTLVTEGFVDANGCSVSVRTEGGLVDEFNCTFATATGVYDLATIGANWLHPRGTGDMGRMIMTINATAEEATDLTNMTTVTSDTFDPDMSNNVAVDTLSVEGVADLTLSVSAMGEVQVGSEAGDVFDITSPDPFPFAPQYTTDPDIATAGRRIAYTITVNNDGPSLSRNVVLVDNLPDGVTLIPGTLTSSKGSCSTNESQMICGLGTMGSSTEETVSFHVYVDPSLDPGAVLNNDVYVLADTYDIDNGNDFAGTQTIVETWADMEITKLSVGSNVTDYVTDLRRHKIEALPGMVTPGMTLRYEITVQNSGPSDARGVQILDLMPGQSTTGLDFDPVTFLFASGASCDPLSEQQELGIFNGGGGQFGQVIWCDLDLIPVGGRETFYLYVQTDPSIPDGTTLTNGAFVWWGPSSPPAEPSTFSPFPFPQIPAEAPTTNDPLTNSNFADTDTRSEAVADVWITTVDVPADEALDNTTEPDHAVAGDEHRYLVTIGNDGPSDAQDVRVQHLLDLKNFGILGETFLRCEPFDIDDFVSCSETSGVVNVDLLLAQNEQVLPGHLGAGESIQFYLVTRVSPAYVLEADDFVATHDSRITTTTTDYHTSNNVDAHDSLIVAEADLSITKTSEYVEQAFAVPEASGVMTYTIAVTNNGPSAAAQVNVVDYLPDGLVLDPLFIQASVTDGAVVEVSESGLLTVVVGEDADFTSTPQLGRMNSGTTEVITIVAYVRDDVESGTLVNSAIVETRQDTTTWPTAPDLLPGIGGGARTPTVDPELNNNTASTGDPLLDSANLMLTSTMNPLYIDPGDIVTYALIVTNTGPMQAENVMVMDYLPGGSRYLNTTISVPGVCLGTTTLECHIGHMNVGDVVLIEVMVELDPEMPLDVVVKNDASVMSDDFDPQLVDNYTSLAQTTGYVLLDKQIFLPMVVFP